MKLTPFIPQDLCSHVFSPSSRENMLVPLAGSGPLMNDWTSSILSVSKSLVKSFLRSSDCTFRISFFPTWMIIRFAVLCFIRMFWSSLFTSETVAWGKQHVVVVLLLILLIIESPTIRVLGSAAFWAECRCLLDLKHLLVTMLATGWFDPCLVTFGDSSPTFINALNLFSRCIGGCRLPVFTSLVIAVSRIEDATAAIWDTRDNLMSREPLGLAPCFCHQLVCRSVSACSSTLGINSWESLDSQDCMLRGSVMTIYCVFHLFWKSSK